MFDLTGRVALVTGAGRGIGEGIARVLARRGAATGVNDINAANAETTAKAIREAGGAAVACPFDVTSFEACEEGVRFVKAELGPIDILVNNAGGTPSGVWPTPFRETPRERWHEYVDMNLYGVLHCTRAVVDGMAERGFGRIVSISSDAARLGHHGSSIYGAAKAGIEGFMRSLAKEVGCRGVTANSVALGLIDTADPAFFEGQDFGRHYAVGRIGTPEDVAAGVVYLVSDEAGWVTGQTLVINGGFLGA
jgi:NAD(P)-dependent dehydrogenase (short-subunit alcohol dehydrogenase family)